MALGLLLLALGSGAQAEITITVAVRRHPGGVQQRHVQIGKLTMAGLIVGRVVQVTAGPEGTSIPASEPITTAIRPASVPRKRTIKSVGINVTMKLAAISARINLGRMTIACCSNSLPASSMTSDRLKMDIRRGFTTAAGRSRRPWDPTRPGQRYRWQHWDW